MTVTHLKIEVSGAVPVCIMPKYLKVAKVIPGRPQDLLVCPLRSGLP